MKTIDKERKFIISISLREREINKLNMLKGILEDRSKGYSNIIRILISSDRIQKGS